MMPELDGLSTLRVLRQHALWGAVPVVLITAKAQPDDVAQYLELDTLAVITKPFDAMTLADTLRTLWEKLP